MAVIQRFPSIEMLRQTRRMGRWRRMLALFGEASGQTGARNRNPNVEALLIP